MKSKWLLALAILSFVIACGDSDRAPESPTDAGVSERVINGVEVSQADFPQYVKVLNWRNSGQVGSCTGTMIGAQAVLTAAHCLDDYQTVAIQTEGVDGPLFYAQAVYLGAGYMRDPAVGIINDIAVVITEQPTGRPALPLLASTYPTPGEQIMVIGFGLEDAVNGSFGILRQGVMPVSDVNSYHLAVSYDGTSANVCFGDSGGPAIYFVQDEAGNTLGAGIAAVVSWGTSSDCSPGETTFYTNLTPFIGAILAIVPDVTLL